MKIVIDIPDDLYKGIVDDKCGVHEGRIYNIIRSGTPLPKGHGRLIDADAIEYTHAIARSLDDGHNWNELCVTEDEIYDAPTIIEADKEEVRDKHDRTDYNVCDRYGNDR